MPTLLESEIEAAAVRRAKAAGWLALKNGGQGNARGWPDRLFMRLGPLYAWVEFKRPGQKPTELQARRIRELEQIGANVRVCFSADEAMEFLAECQRPGRNYYPGAEDL